MRNDKSIDLLLKAVTEMYQPNEKLYLVVAGTLNVTDKDYYKSLADKCTETGAALIAFDYVDKELEGYYYSAADILVLPYSFISQSGVAYCGLLYHLPMIASDIPRWAGMVQSGVNADMFKKGDEVDLERRILSLSGDEARMRAYRKGSENILNHDFSIKKRVELTEKAYGQLFSQYGNN